MKRSHVLVVDDSILVRMALTRTLERIPDLRISEAGDGEDALRKLTEDDYDLAIVDLNMPVMDGLTLIKLMREGLDQAISTSLIPRADVAYHRSLIDESRNGESSMIPTRTDIEDAQARERVVG